MFEQKNDIARAVEDELGKVIGLSTAVLYVFTISSAFCLCDQAMSSYGYKIVQTLIVDIEPDNHVKKAMNEINAGKYRLLS